MEVEEEDLGNENYKVKELEEIIKDKIIKNICKFKYKADEGDIEGTGFLCKINFINNNIMPVLITCNHLLEEDFEIKNNDLSFLHYLKGEEKNEKINLKVKRIFYRNKDLDIIIIEIKEEDNLDIFDFLSIDNYVNIENPNLNNQKVYLLHYPKSFKDLHITKGHITHILSKYNEKIDKYIYINFLTDYASFEGSSGSPLLNYKNNKVIGLHKGGIPSSTEKIIGEQIKEEKIKIAIIIKKAINQFIIDKSKQNNLYYISPYSYIVTIDIIYNFPYENSIKIFGTEFVERYNMNEAIKIIHNGEEYPLTEYFYITNDDNQDGHFKIKLKGVNMMTDLKYMFRFVNNLLDVPNISRMDTSNVESMWSMFEGCEKLVELKGINRWNVEKVVTMRGMFYRCLNLKYLSEIEDWNPIKLEDCDEMFYGCKSLMNSEASKIEKWKNVNPEIIKKAFNGYSFGKDTNIILHSLSQPEETLNNLIDEGLNGVINFLFKNNYN